MSKHSLLNEDVILHTPRPALVAINALNERVRQLKFANEKLLDILRQDCMHSASRSSSVDRSVARNRSQVRHGGTKAGKGSRQVFGTEDKARNTPPGTCPYCNSSVPEQENNSTDQSTQGHDRSPGCSTTHKGMSGEQAEHCKKIQALCSMLGFDLGSSEIQKMIDRANGIFQCLFSSNSVEDHQKSRTHLEQPEEENTKPQARFQRRGLQAKRSRVARSCRTTRPGHAGQGQ